MSTLRDIDNYFQEFIEKYMLYKVHVTLFSHGCEGHTLWVRAMVDLVRLRKEYDESNIPFHAYGTMHKQAYDCLGDVYNLKIQANPFGHCTFEGKEFDELSSREREWICNNLEYIEHRVKLRCDEIIKREREEWNAKVEVKPVCTTKINKFLKSRGG